MTTGTVIEMISMKVLKEEANMTVIIGNVAVIMIGWTIHHAFLLFSDQISQAMYRLAAFYVLFTISYIVQYVPFVGIMTMIVIEIQETDMEHIQRDPGENLDLDHGPDPLLNLKGTRTSIFSLSFVLLTY